MWEKKGKGNGNGNNDGNTAYHKVSEVDVGGVEKDQLVGDTIKEALDMILSAKYQHPSFSSLSMSGLISRNVELGFKIEGTKTFNFGFNANGNVLENTVALEQDGITLISNQPKTGSITTPINVFQYNVPTAKSFKFKAESIRNVIFQDFLSINWRYTIYSGVADNKDLSEITANFVKANLVGTLSNLHFPTISGNIGVGKRLYYIYPVALGLRKLKTSLGVEGDSLISSGGLEIKTASQNTFNLNGIDYAICKNEQSNLGLSHRDIVTF